MTLTLLCQYEIGLDIEHYGDEQKSREAPDTDYVHAISAKFDIDQVQAFILLRSFLYNGWWPQNTELDVVDEFVEAMTPFYLQERLSVLRVLTAIFQSRITDTDLHHEIATELVPKIIPDGCEFAESLLCCLWFQLHGGQGAW